MMIILFVFFFFSSRRRHTRCSRDWSSDVCSSDLFDARALAGDQPEIAVDVFGVVKNIGRADDVIDRKSTRLNSSHGYISYAVFCLKKKKNKSSTSTAYNMRSMLQLIKSLLCVATT